MRSKLEKEHRVRGKRGRPQHEEEYRVRKRGRPQLEEVLRVSGKRGRSQHRGGGCSQRKERQATPGEGVQSDGREAGHTWSRSTESDGREAGHTWRKDR